MKKANCLLRIVMTLLSTQAFGAEYLITPDSPPIKRVLSSGKHTAVVQLHQSKITVRLAGNGSSFQNEKPSTLLLTLYDDKNNPTTYELKSLSSSSMGSDSSGASENTYTGNLLYGRVPGEATTSAGTARESFVGLEIRIPLPSSAPEVLTLLPD